MATNKASPTPVLVLDMTSLRFSWTEQRDAVAALTQRGEVLAVVDAVPDEATSRVAYRAMDAALERSFVLRRDPASRQETGLRVALYNPFTGEVAFGAVPGTVAFSDGQRLALPGSGAPGAVVDGADGLRLVIGQRTLCPHTTSFAQLTRLASSHHD